MLALTPENRFLITADHVVREIDSLRKPHALVVLLGGVGAPPVDISSWGVIDRCPNVDICTIQIPPEFDPIVLNKAFFSLSNWPLPSAIVGDRVLIVVYPAAHRQVTHSTINTRALLVGDYVTDVGPRRFTVADEHDGREVLINLQNLSFPLHLGGMSGAPAFGLNDPAKPQLLGVFSEGTDGLRGAYLCAHAQFLLPSGEVDGTRVPPR